MMKITPTCATCFEGLSVASRIQIVNLLQQRGPLAVSSIVKRFKLRQPTITHHLKYLKHAGILASEKKGRQVFYFIKTRCRGGNCNVFS